MLLNLTFEKCMNSNLFLFIQGGHIELICKLNLIFKYNVFGYGYFKT